MQSLPDMNELRKLSASPAGQKLLSSLKNSNLDLDQLSREASAGNLDAIKQQLSSLLASEETREVLKQLQRDL